MRSYEKKQKIEEANKRLEQRRIAEMSGGGYQEKLMKSQNLQPNDIISDYDGNKYMVIQNYGEGVRARDTNGKQRDFTHGEIAQKMIFGAI